MNISKDLDTNIQGIERLFTDCGDIVKRKFPVGENKDVWVCIFYIDAMVNREVIEKNIVSNFIVNIRCVPPDFSDVRNNIYDALLNGGITASDVKESNNLDSIAVMLMSGETAVFIDGFDKAIVVSTKGWPSRGVPTTDSEVVVQGSKEAFSEGLRTNTALIRRRIRDTNLKIKQRKIGRRSKTDVAILYLEDVVRKDILKDLIDRIDNIDIDAILDIGYVEQLIEDNWFSPFPQTQITERPDKAAAAILEGRVVVIVDNSPYVMIIPSTMNVFFQSAEDYYQRWEIMSFVRVLRYIAGIIAVILPALYVATTVFHPSMIPMLLVFKMSGARQAVPFPTVVEVLIMDIAYELLREAGIRLPGPVGGTIGIVGGIIIGQAAVEAGIVSPIVVIIIALTGICTFAIPHVAFASAFRIVKYLLILFSAILGVFGFWLGFFIIMIHLVSLKSFGIPYMFPYTSGSINDYSDVKDSILRFPLFSMTKRPIFANPEQKIRMKSNSGNIRKKE